MTGSRRLTLVIGFTQTLAYATSYYVPAVVTGSAAAEMGASPTLLLGGFSWSMLIAGFLAPRVGVQIERSGGRLVLATGKLVLALGLAIMAAVPTVPGWYAAWTVMGLGMGCGLYDAAFATIGRLLGGEARPVIVGVTLIAGFASSIGWAAGAMGVGALGWRTTLLGYAALDLGVALPLVLLLVPAAPPTPPSRPVSGGAPPAPPGMRRAMVLLSVFFSLRSGIMAVVSVHILALMQGLGLSAGEAIAAAALIGPAQVGARLAEWSLVRWANPLVASRLGAALMPAGIAGLLAGAPVWLFPITYGASNGLLAISRGVLPLYLFGADGYAARLGRLALPPLLLQAVAPTLATPFILGAPAATVLLWIGAIAALAGTCLFLFRRVERPQPEKPVNPPVMRL